MTEIFFLYGRAIIDFVEMNNFERKSLEEAVTVEIEALCKSGLRNPLDLIMHVFDWHGQDFIITGGEKNGTRVLFVDLCEYTDGPEISEGPFKGQKLSMPVPVGKKEEVLERYPELESKKVTKH